MTHPDRHPDQQPVHEFLAALVGPDGALPDPDVDLPDHDRLGDEERQWVAGGLDGSRAAHPSSRADTEDVEELAALVVAAARAPHPPHPPHPRRVDRLCQALADVDLLAALDPLLERVAELATGARGSGDLAGLGDLGLLLATSATDRAPVKLGIALMGLAGLDGDHLAVVRLLGAHEEFTLHAATAIANGVPEPDQELWALARTVTGWGRVHCVWRLRETGDPAIRGWILRHGFRNDVDEGLLAHVAATTGGLLPALRGTVDAELLDSAGAVVLALVSGGPTEDVDDYDDAAPAVELLVGHLTTRARSLHDHAVLSGLRDFLTDDDRDWTGWLREALLERCDLVLARPEWDDRVTVGLLSTDDEEFGLAHVAARARGTDTFDALVARITDAPLDAWWYEAWEQVDPARADRLVDLATGLLPLDDIASGAAAELGTGPAWAPHRALDWSLQALGEHPGTGTRLLLAGLASPVVRNRYLALAALEAWPRPAWPTDALRAVRRVAASDPDERLRERAGETLAVSERGDPGAT